MRRLRFFRFLVLAIGIAGTGASWAADNPELLSSENGVSLGDGQPGGTSVLITRLAIDVRVHGHVADVSLEAKLSNPGEDTDEARFSLVLPPDAVVTGYALDVNGRMIPGHLVDQPKARNVYEDEVREGIDPGLAELVDENRFQAKVYPVTTDMPRTIRISFAAPLGTLQGLVLPLHVANPIEEVDLSVHLAGYRVPPQVMVGDKVVATVRNGQGWSASAQWRSIQDLGNLRVSGGESAERLLVSLHRNESAFFQIRDTADPQRAVPSPPTVGRVRVYWDRSLSRRDDLLQAEASLLFAYLDASHPESVDLVTFASDSPAVTTLRGPEEVRAALSRVVYRGGTRFGALDEVKLEPADQCLLFTDGLPTVDEEARFRPECRLSIITSARNAGAQRLGRMAQSTTGQLLRLSSDNQPELLQRLLRPVVSVVSARDTSGNRLDFRALPAGPSGWLVVGRMPALGDVVLTVAGLRKGLTTRIYRADGRKTGKCDAPGALWASQRVAELADNPSSRTRMDGLARQFQVASPDLAFLVLENPGQYLRAGIRPPDGFPAEWMQEYREAKKEEERSSAERRKEHFEFVLAQWKQRKAWWSQPFIPLPREHAPDERVFAAGTTAAYAGAGGGLEEVMVTAQQVRTDVQDSPVALTALTTTDEAGSTIELDVADVLADQPYLHALDAAGSAQRLQVLAEQEKTFGLLPAFYLETSEWFRLKDDPKTAEDLLYSALELAVTDDETRQIVAFRLQRDGNPDRAINMLERIGVTSGYRPQPKRALALALAERGRQRGLAGRADLERAFTLLTAVALESTLEDFDGLEVIALMEANALVAAIEAAGGEWQLDPRLVALLDTDLRIVIEWTIDDADVDLWVIEPNGERVYYGDTVSSSGGLISNDMTDGYGPEEYVIRHAPPGDYEVRINGFDADRLNPNGKGRVMVRMFRDFARANARQTLVDADISFETGSDRDAGGGRRIAGLKVDRRERKPAGGATRH
ncbi:MAG: hypothetical protein IT482_16125 [Gammaproteobacteria bacterium]|nr:hypothetical protein [Gammaproteobacteria bacterium]